MIRMIGWLLASSVGLLTLSGCTAIGKAVLQEASEPSEAETVTPPPAKVAPPAASVASAPTPPPTAPAPNPARNFFGEGVNRAQSAVAIGQAAQSSDDWNLAASRWEQAVALMQQVPQGDPNYSTAKQKVQEYRRNLTQAKQRATGEAPTAAPVADPNRPPGLVTRIPVLGQMGGTPIVPVSLKGNQGQQQFTMLFDTGASATLITPAMAQAIGVVVVDTAIVTVADGRQVEIPIGYVDTLQVEDLVVRDLTVGIGGDVALLGQDVYGQYGLSIGGSTIDLYQ